MCNYKWWNSGAPDIFRGVMVWESINLYAAVIDLAPSNGKENIQDRAAQLNLYCPLNGKRERKTWAVYRSWPTPLVSSLPMQKIANVYNCLWHKIMDQLQSSVFASSMSMRIICSCDPSGTSAAERSGLSFPGLRSCCRLTGATHTSAPLGL